MTREQDQALEALIISKGLTAPRVTVDQIDKLVAGLSFDTYVVPGTTTTIAAAIGPGAFVIATGFSAAASSANFDEQVGRLRAIGRARDAAREKLWELEGWRLKLNLLELAEAGQLDRTLSPEILEVVGDEWPATAVPAAAARAVCRSCPTRACDDCQGVNGSA